MNAAQFPFQGVALLITAIFSGLAVVISAMNHQKISDAAVTAKETHALVNSDRGVILRVVATTLQRVAVLTKALDDQKAANDAKMAADNHDATQAKLNATKPT
jgi:hypothetical protein